MFINYLKLIRIQNLAIITLTMYLMRWLIIYPVLKYNGFEFQFSHLDFFLLTMATIFITAGGYVINDYFDRKTDLINCPKKVIVGSKIKRRHAMLLHNILNVIGVGLGFYVAYKINLFNIGFIFPIISGILWFYSTTYKNQVFVGNIIVALLIAIIPLMPVLFEIPVLNTKYNQILIENNGNFNVLFFFTLGFAFFAFLTNLTREIIKDTEDIEGDKEYERRTIPIAYGIKNTKIIIQILIYVTIIAIAFTSIFYLNDKYTTLYFVIGLIIPLIFLSFKILTAKESKDYKKASTILKVIMLIGLGYSFLIYTSLQ